MTQPSIELIDWFRQSAPYIHAHRNKTFVIMLGGEALCHDNFARIVHDIALLHSLGVRLVITYGARPQIERSLVDHGIQSQYHENLRITDENSLEFIKQEVGAQLINIQGMFSMGLVNSPMAGARINVMTGNFLKAQPIGVRDGVDFCYTGAVRSIDAEGIRKQLDQHNMVLIPPLGFSATGEVFNLYAEEVATRVAIALQADKIIGFCSEQGVLDKDDELIDEMTPEQAEDRLQELLADKEYDSGTVRYLRSAIAACHAGVARSHLVSYQQDGALLTELFTRDGVGTQIVRRSYERERQARADDVNGIIELIRPLEDRGILVKRSRELLEAEVDRFTIIERDGMVIGCAALYPFIEEQAGELACLVMHPDYRGSERGERLVRAIEQAARRQGIRKLFALSTHTIMWLRERGFVPAGLEDLPQERQKMYNFQRNSKILLKNLY